MLLTILPSHGGLAEIPHGDQNLTTAQPDRALPHSNPVACCGRVRSSGLGSK